MKNVAISLAWGTTEAHGTYTITATGTVSNVTMHNAKEKAKDEAAATGMKKTNDEHGDMQVSSVRMVSKSCK